ncbi:MAG: TetR/AcrR family transcriptional regulator [Devosia sp.]
MTVARKRPTDLKEACLAEALTIIDRDGVESLSMREVSRRLSISHQAPYKHFESRDHILAEVVGRAFDSFAAFLRDRCTAQSPAERLRQMGLAYVDFAEAHPLQYRLMFMTPLPEPAKHRDMTARSQQGFSMLLDTLRQSAAAQGAERSEDAIYADAVFILAALHGMASLTSTATLSALDVPYAVQEDLVENLLVRIGAGIGKVGDLNAE